MSENKMKLSLFMLAIPLIAGSISSAMAASTPGPSGELIVTGEYKPAACHATLSNQGALDYGRMPASSLNATTYTTLPIKTLADAITVTCESATSVGIDITDNRATSVVYTDIAKAMNRGLPSGMTNVNMVYGLGVDSASNKIGNYIAELNNARVDGVQAYFSENGFLFSPTSFANPAAPFGIPSQNNGYVFVDKSHTTLIGKVFISDFSAHPEIAPTNNLSLSKEITLDGSATINLYYL